LAKPLQGRIESVCRLKEYYEELVRSIQKLLKAELPEADYLGHPDVKLLAAVMVGIKEKIAVDSLAA
jgi:hypothetical protein